MSKTWLYHKDHPPQVFNSDDVPKLTEEGWRDSPEAAKEVDNEPKRVLRKPKGD